MICTYEEYLKQSKAISFKKMQMIHKISAISYFLTASTLHTTARQGCEIFV